MNFLKNTVSLLVIFFIPLCIEAHHEQSGVLYPHIKNLDITSNRISPEYPHFTIEDVEEKIQQSNARYLSQLIEALPEAWTLMRLEAFSSRSLQCATAKAPRVIFFSTNGQAYCSFNSGDPRDYQSTGNNCLDTINHLECLYRDSNGLIQNRTFEFEPEPMYRNHFTQIPNFQREYDEIVTAHLGHVKAFDKPRACVGCHLSESRNEGGFNISSRVIMDQYFAWPGFFGGNDSDYADSANHPEYEKEREFFSNNQNPRYSALPAFGNRELHKRRFAELANFHLAPIQLFNFTQHTNNTYRMVDVLKQIQRTNNFSTILAPLLSYDFNSCITNEQTYEGDIDKALELFPTDLTSRVRPILERLISENSQASVEHTQSNLDLFDELLGVESYNYGRIRDQGVSTTSGQDIDVVAARRAGTPITFRSGHMSSIYVLKLSLLRLVFELSGIDSWKFSGNFDNTFYFQSAQNILLGGSSPLDPLDIFLKEIGNSVLNQIQTTSTTNQNICEQLKERSRKNLRGLVIQ